MAYLTRLDIHGFKSFARPTSFVFDDGITAIIGPNGSGKSNVAEALRWVLGETRYSALRGRRTEDVIFAGSATQARLGLAEVTLTLDNADGELPIAFSEVTVTRRADRSGDNQYLINGSRVLLRDVQQLTASLGQAHTIIGQGLVDAVLSQRPEDRRGLFEHAAGITGLRLQATEAERGLSEATANAQRLRDILAELEPRVRSLGRAARQARDYRDVRRQLSELQRSYYGALWRDLKARQAAETSALAEADQQLEAAEAEQHRAAVDLARSRERERTFVERIAELQAKYAAKDRELAAASHRLDLLASELRALRQRQRDLSAARDDQSRRLESGRARLEQTKLEIDAAERDLATLDGQLREQEAGHEKDRARKVELELLLNDVSERTLALAREIAETEGRISAAVASAAAASAERHRVDAEIADVRRRHAELRSKATATEREFEQVVEEQQLASQSAEQAQQEVAGDAATFESVAGAAESNRQELIRMRSRLTLLERIYQEGEGLHAGPKAVLLGVRSGDLELPGLLGTLSELIRTPREYETAIETALGGHLQDLVVQRWSDAERAIAFLNEKQAGRATFQPLETVRHPSRRPDLPNQDPGLVGIASELIDYDIEIEPVIEGLLGRTLVITDLSASRRILGATRGWTLVTLSGEITRPSGSVTGGRYRRPTGVLRQERERRALPGQISQLEREAEALAARQAEHAERLSWLRTRRTQAEAAARQLADAAERKEHELAELRRQLAAGEAEENRLVSLAQAAAERQATSGDAERELNLQLANLEDERRTISRKRDELAAELERVGKRIDETTTIHQIAAAGQRERLKALVRERDGATRLVDEAERSLRSLQQQLNELELTEQQFSDQLAECESAIGDIRAEITSVEKALGPVEHDRAAIAERVAEEEQLRDASIERVRQAERERDQAALQATRSRDEQVYLAERISADLEAPDPDELIAEAGEIGPEIEQQIQRLRNRLRRMSAVSGDVVEEFEEESARLEYLTSQLDDVEGAATSLTRVLAELRAQMTAQFNATFRDVTREFEGVFKRLFGGGVARLSHESEADEPAGVTIEARPPGKRLQNLSQLSGGERALTAVALLMAIQRVNPSPFCLLDEVDAALDESNVLRFCDELRDLARSTQYIVITHNRGTIESADALYGITMGADKTSRVISLRLEQALETVAERETVETII